MGKENKKVLIDVEELVDIVQKSVRDEIENCITECRFGTEYKDEVWSRKQVAGFLDMTPEKVTELVTKKEIPHRKIGREYKFLKSQITGLFKNQRR